jgi:colanic acid/amylovoran biosynthesis glycosyltransferase
VIRAERVREALRIGYLLGPVSAELQTYLLAEIDALEALGAQVHVFALGVPSLPFVLRALRRVRGPVICLTRPADVPAAEPADEEELHAARVAGAARERGLHTLRAYFSGAAARVARAAAKQAGISYTVTPHIRELVKESVTDSGERSWRALILEAGAVIASSERALAALKQGVPEAASRIVAIPQGLELDGLPFRVTRELSGQIVVSTSLVTDTGLETLLLALAMVRERDVDFSCIVLGSGPLEQEMRARVGLLGIEDAVRFAGERSEAESDVLLQRASIYVGMWLGDAREDLEGPRRILLRAMALGTPCVVTDACAAFEVIQDGETGLEVPLNRPAVMASALRRLLTSSAYRERLAVAGRRLIEQHYDVRANARVLLRVLDEASRDGSAAEIARMPSVAPVAPAHEERRSP